MPWTVKDAKEKNKSLKTAKEARMWVHVANTTLKRLLAKGVSREQAESRAIRAANSSVAEMHRKGGPKEGTVEDGHQFLQEYADARGLKLSVDLEQSIIPGVKLLGLESANRRTYPKQVVAEAAALYDGVKVNVDHAEDPDQVRSYRDSIGVIRNPRLGSGETGLFADFHFNPKHPVAEQLAWDAENSPESVGFSHVVEAKVVPRSNPQKIEEIRRVLSVDLVSNPATTRGLFEGELADKLDADEKLEGVQKINWAAQDLIRQTMDDADSSPPAKRVRIVAILDEWEDKLQAAQVGEGYQTQQVQRGEIMNWDELSEAAIREHRPDVVKVIAEQAVTAHVSSEEVKTAKAAQEAKIQELTEETKTLKGKVDEYEALEALAAKKAAVEKELTEAKLPKELVTDVFRQQLMEAKDEAARKAMITDRMEIAKLQTGQRPVSRDQGSVEGPEVTNAKQFAEATAD